MKIDFFNKSKVSNNIANEFVRDVESRMSSIDFADFGLADWTMHIVIDADSNSVSLANPLDDSKKFIHFQGIPSAINYNSAFEAKIVNIRLRLQNMKIPFWDNINNIIFIIDFASSTDVNENKESHKQDSQQQAKSNIQESASLADSMRNLFKKKNDKEDEDAARLAKFVPTAPKHSLESVVMTESMKQDIEEALSIIRNRKKIYEDWGFAEVDAQPKAVLNFWGPPGTGKTKCAQGIAMAMGQKILCVNYAEIESKYAGESPKNLIAAFHAAQDNNAILFFDEADSFLGKRIGNVQSGHDQSINSLRSQMLIQLEDFEGIVIFATNLVKNFDPAFETRILRHIKFDMPDQNGRIALFKMLIPTKAPLPSPLTEADFERLATASDGFSGRDIRNTILDSLSSIAKNGTDILDIDTIMTAISKRQQSYTKLKEEKGQENKKIVDDIKSSIEANAKKEFNEALVAIALYAAMSDDTMPQEEEQLLMEYASALNVDLPVGLNLEYFPPITNVIPYFNTRDKKLRAIDVVLRVIAIDGVFADGEKRFVEKVCDLMEFSQVQKESFLNYGVQLSKLNSYWKNITSC
jgi:ATP-dependent 26S proteasome regulatory subunit